MAPELFAGPVHDRRTDIWALASVCFECLCGRSPFVARNFLELVTKIRSEAPVFPAPMGGIETVLRRALARDPAQRFQSADEFSAALVGS